jgi:photosystem II stability/assembly factor-like uncharacterized protein
MLGVQRAAGWCACDRSVRLSQGAWRIAAALLLVLLPAIVHAGNQVWTGTSPRAKSIEAIAADPLNPLRFWAATFGGGVARTTDGGATWTTERTGLVTTFVRCLAAQPHHPDSLYCGTNDGVFLSTDGGLSFSKLLSTNVSVRAIAIHPIRTGVIYAATNGSGVYKSINAGKNWSQINLGLTNVNVRDVAINPAQAAGAAERGEAGLGGDPGAGERGDGLGAGEGFARSGEERGVEVGQGGGLRIAGPKTPHDRAAQLHCPRTATSTDHSGSCFCAG